MLTSGALSYLLAQPAISAIVGTSIQPIPAPEDLTSYPCITYQSASYMPEYANDGPVGVSKSRVVYDCLAVRYLDARTTALAVSASLSGYSGVLPDGTKVYETEIVNMVDGYDDGSRIYKTSVHAMFQFAD